MIKWKNTVHMRWNQWDKETNKITEQEIKDIGKRIHNHKHMNSLFYCAVVLIRKKSQLFN